MKKTLIFISSASTSYFSYLSYTSPCWRPPFVQSSAPPADPKLIAASLPAPHWWQPPSLSSSTSAASLPPFLELLSKELHLKCSGWPSPYPVGLLALSYYAYQRTMVLLHTSGSDEKEREGKIREMKMRMWMKKKMKIKGFFAYVHDH
jgi:hypothetical protein